MDLWSKKLLLRKKRALKHARRSRMLTPPEPLEQRQMLATVSGDISQDTTWSGIEEVTGSIHVLSNATLTIQPGTVIKFDVARDFAIQVDGKMLAQGTPENPIYFTSLYDDTAGGDTNGDGNATHPGPFHWESINFTNPNASSVLDNVIVRYGGENVPGQIIVNGGELTLTNSTLASSATAGIRILGASPTLTNVTFLNNDVAASMDLAASPIIQGVKFKRDTDTANTNTINALKVDGGTLSTDKTWNNPDITYYFTGNVTVPQGKSLTIGAGQVLKYRDRLDIGLIVNGTLSAIGTETKPIVFTEVEDDSVGGAVQADNQRPAPGRWESLKFNSTSVGSVLDHVEVRYAGENVPGAIIVDGGQLSLSNSKLQGSATAGIRVQNANPTISGVFFEDNAIAASMDLGSNPAINATSLLNNGVNGLQVDGGTLTIDGQWDDPAIVYLIQGTVTVPTGKTLSIAPGQIVKVRAAQNFTITVNGTLSAVGTANTPVVFTSAENDSLDGDTTGNGNQPPRSGDWAGLRFNAASAGNLLQNVEVQYAGENGDAAILSVGGPLTIADSKIVSSLYSGIRIEDATNTLSNVSFEKNGAAAIALNLGGDVALNGVSVAGNGADAIVLDGGALSTSRSLVAVGLPYQLRAGLSIAADTTLTIGPGAIFEALEFFPISGPGTLENAGLIRKSMGSTATYSAAVTNTGTIKNLSGTFNFAGGLTNAAGGAITGPIGPTIAVGRNFDGTTQNVAAFAPLGKILFNGSGTQASPQLLEPLSADKGASGTGFEHNFGLYSLALAGNTYVKLVDNADNAGGSGAEAVYTANLIVPAGTTLDLNNLHLYTRASQVGGTVKNGTVTLIPDGGPLARDAYTPGKISTAGEIDDWTIFGRAGDLLTISLSTGNPGVAPPITPQLSFGQITLFGPDGKTISTSSNTTTGVDVALNAVSLAADGTYHIKVQAPSNHATFTGNYVLSASSATVNTAPLQLGKIITGRIDHAFTSDKWTFSVAADQVVNFALLNAESSGIQFDLSGPSGFSANGLSNSTGNISLHNPGTYAITVHGNQQQTGAYAFRLDQTAVAQLNLGTPLTMNIAGSGQSQLFQLNVPQPQQLVVSLTDANSADRNEVYVSQGTPPTRSDYQYKFETPASANQRVSIPSASAGTWYVLVFNENALQTGSFTLKATGGSTFLQSASPARGSTSVDTVITLTGLGFDSTTTVQVVAGASSIPASSVHLDLPTQLSVTFAAGSVPAGDYAIQVNNQPNTTAIPFTFVSGAQSKLVVSVDAPKGLGYHSISTFYLNYKNEGDAAMPAPLLSFTPTQTHKVNGVEVTEHNAFLTLDRSRLVSGFATSGLPDGFAHTIQLLASGNTPGVLQPGEAMRVPIYWAGWQQPWDLSYPAFHFDIHAAGVDETAPIDWDALKANIPSSFNPAARDAIWANVKTQMGSTLGDYVATLDKTAAYLGQFGQHVTSVSQLFEFQLDIANGLTIAPQLLTITDASSPAPGIPLNFNRLYSALLDDRNRLGPLGRGWMWLEGWDDTVSVEDGNAVVRSSNGKQAVFFPRPGGGYYISPPGDSGKLLGSAGNPWMLQETDGSITAYRADGHVDYVRDPSGNQVSAAYSNGLLTKLTHSSGQTMQFTYNAAGRMTSVTDNEGRVTQFSYDVSNEHLMTVTDSNGLVTTYAYDTSGNLLTQHALLSAAYPDGSHVFFGYDTRGRLSESHQDGNAQKVSFAYGGLGQISETGANGATTTALFDNYGRIAQSEDPLHRRTFNQFDANGVLVATVDAAGQRLTYGYDEFGKLASITDPLGHTVKYEHKGLRGTLSKVTDAKGNSIRFMHGYNGKLTSTIYADGLTESNVYDLIGNLIQSTDRKGQTTVYTNDSAGRMLTESFADGSKITYAYDAHGNLTSAVDTAHGTVTLAYNSHDQLTEVDYPGGKFLKYQYDGAGRRMQMIDQIGFTVNYSYDSVGQFTGLTDGSNATIVSYTYDDAGQIKRKDNGNGTYTTYQYDLLGQLQHLMNFAPDNSISSRFDYTHDAVGNVTSMATLDGQWTYGYDANGRLLRAVFLSTNLAAVPNQDLQYVYDAAGNRTSTIINGVTTAYTANNLNQYTAIGTDSLQYDRNGNLITSTQGGATTTYIYDVRDRLTAVSAPGDNWSYQYDALGHIASETHNGQTIQNLVDDAGLGDVVAQFDGTGALIAHFTYGNGLASRVDAAGAKAYYNFDASANTVAMTGAGGAILNSYRYLPFGSLLTSTEALANPFEFDGQEGVRVGGPALHFMRARFYDSVAGRFMQMDPAGIEGGLNLYTYAENTPINDSDPSGLKPTFASKAVEQAYLRLLQQERAARTAIQNLPKRDVEKALLNARQGFKNAGQGIKAATAAEVTAGAGTAGAGSAGATEAGLLARTGGKLARLGGAAANILKGLLYAAAFGTGQAIGERWAWKRKFEDDLYKTLDTNVPKIAWILAGAEDLLGINIFSIDPNDKIGPAGAGPGNFVSGNAALPYKIDFENDPAATGPAQSVTVSDILSSNFDLDTFELTGIKFGDIVLTPSPGSQYFATTVQMTQDDKTFNVNVEAGLRTANREVFATFQSIDPDLQLPPEVIYGFLPPEPAHVSDPVAEAATPGRGRGQGQITYTIKPKAGLPTGTTITNIAKIIFDQNPSIATDQINPHDASAGSDPTKQASVRIISGSPVSHINALTPKENDSFTVKWTGEDGINGASLAKYDVFLSQDAGPFSIWQTGIAATSALFTGAVPNHTYAFYVVATDYLGQVEAKQAIPETQTKVSTNPWQNAEKNVDSDHDTFVVASDVIVIINYINALGSGLLPASRPTGKAFVDVDGDKNVTASDVVTIINYINAHPGQDAEAQAAQLTLAAASPVDLNSLPMPNDLLGMLAADVASQRRRRRFS
jgi:RHS repeat-associated protein